MAATLIVLLVSPVLAQDGRPEDIPTKMVNPPGMVDRLVMLDTPEEWTAGKLEDVDVITSLTPSRLLMGYPERDFPRRGRWMTAEIEADFPFTEVLPSWSAETPKDTGITIQLRTRDAESGEWSPWLYMGQWGRTVHWPSRTLWFEGKSGEAGAVNTDYLLLRRPANALQARVDFLSFDIEDKLRPALHRLVLAYAGVVEDEARRTELLAGYHPPSKALSTGEEIDLAVPFFGNGMTGPDMKSSTCSPSSTTMAMSWHGVNRPLMENCAAIFDPEYAIFGSWPRNTARAAELGLDAYVTRVRSWAQVREELERGNPVIASIRFGEGEFPGNVMKETSGHLILVRGLTAEGDPIVNDPASLDKGRRIIYKADELASAWFDKGGAAYIIRRPEQPFQPLPLVPASLPKAK